MTRSAIVAIVVGLLLALVGCGKGDPTKPDDKPPADKGGSTTTGTPAQPGTTPPTPETPAGPTVLKPQDPAQVVATNFVTELRAAAEQPSLPPSVMDKVSSAFLKVIGKPTLTDADKQRGYSADAAAAWLHRAGKALTGIVGLPTGYGTPTAAVVSGPFGDGSQRFLLRLTPADGGWKVDWFQLGTAKATGQPATTPDGSAQDVAVQAFADALTSIATSKEDRVLLLGAVLSPKLRQAWAEPFAQDKDRGYDYDARKLGDRIDGFGGVTAYTRTPTGPDQFKLELTKGGKPETHTLKLVKGATGEWQVDEFAGP